MFIFVPSWSCFISLLITRSLLSCYQLLFRIPGSWAICHCPCPFIFAFYLFSPSAIFIEGILFILKNALHFAPGVFSFANIFSSLCCQRFCGLLFLTLLFSPILFPILVTFSPWSWLLGPSTLSVIIISIVRSDNNNNNKCLC